MQAIDSRPDADRNPGVFLPLKPVLYLLLLSLAEGSCHGYGLKKSVTRHTAGRVKLGPATLYRSIAQLIDDGLVEESAERPDERLDDERRRYYQLTAFGRQVAAAETDRLAALVDAARAMNLTGEAETV